jgi:cold shock CspA family protein
MISICIPSVWGKTGARFIKTTLEEAGWGEIDTIDMIPIRSKDSSEDLFKKVFVHFKTCNEDIRKDLDDGKELEVVYDKEKERSWKITKSRSARPTDGPSPRTTGSRAPDAPGPRTTGSRAPDGPGGFKPHPRPAHAPQDSRIETLQQQVQLLTQMVLMNSGAALSQALPQARSDALPARSSALGAAHAAPRNYRAPKPRIQA